MGNKGLGEGVLDLISGEAIEVIVGLGGDAKLYTLQKALLCAKSPFFAAACRDGFKEAAEKVVRLPYDEPSTFEIFVEWLYTDSSRPCMESEKIYRNLMYPKAWILGDKLNCPRFKNHAIDRLQQYGPTANLVDSIALAYDKTPKGSKLREYFLDKVSKALEEGNRTLRISSNKEQWATLLTSCSEFAQDLLLRMDETTKDRRKWPNQHLDTYYHEWENKS